MQVHFWAFSWTPTSLMYHKIIALVFNWKTSLDNPFCGCIPRAFISLITLVHDWENPLFFSPTVTLHTFGFHLTGLSFQRSFKVRLVPLRFSKEPLVTDDDKLLTGRMPFLSPKTTVPGHWRRWHKYFATTKWRPPMWWNWLSFASKQLLTCCCLTVTRFILRQKQIASLVYTTLNTQFGNCKAKTQMLL